MKSKFPFSLFFLVVLLLAAACRRSETPTLQTNYPQVYQRIISLSPSTTEILFALGLGDHLVGVTRFCNYPPAAQNVARVGGYIDPNYEAIAVLRPDLVVLLPEQVSVKEHLDRLGIAHVTVNNKRMADIIDGIGALGRLIGVSAKADSVIYSINSTAAAIASKTGRLHKPKVMICIGRNIGAGTLEDAYFAGKNTYYDELVAWSGGINAVTKEIAYPMLSAEGVIRCNPDIIVDFIGPSDDARGQLNRAMDDWKKVPGINAVTYNRLHFLTADYIYIPGPRSILLLKDLARIVHPEIDWGRI